LKQFAGGDEREDVFKEIQKEFLKKTQTEWMEIFMHLDACVMPVKSFAEATQDPQIKAREMVVDVEHPKFGKIQNIASPIKYSRTPLTFRNIAPKIGQDTREILETLGYTDDEIKNLKENGIT
jgi:crotonobetainyl-CoA:carnitine CoA-transferase CaiB-like acyl-CoA transferase